MALRQLEAGCGTPVIIKYLFWRRTVRNPAATHANVNYGEAAYQKELRKQAICIDGDSAEALNRL